MVTANNFFLKDHVYIPTCNSTGHSSDGRAIDCRSIGPVFNSQCPENDLSRGLNASTGRHSTFGVVVTYFPSKEVPRFRLPEGAKMVSHSKYFIALLARGRRIETCPLRKRR